MAADQSTQSGCDLSGQGQQKNEIWYHKGGQIVVERVEEDGEDWRDLDLVEHADHLRFDAPRIEYVQM